MSKRENLRSGAVWQNKQLCLWGDTSCICKRKRAIVSKYLLLLSVILPSERNFSIYQEIVSGLVDYVDGTSVFRFALSKDVDGPYKKRSPNESGMRSSQENFAYEKVYLYKFWLYLLEVSYVLFGIEVLIYVLIFLHITDSFFVFLCPQYYFCYINLGFSLVLWQWRLNQSFFF